MKKTFLFLFFIIFVFKTDAYGHENEAIQKNIELLKSQSEHKEKWQAKNNLVKIGKDAVLPLIDSLKDENAKYYAIRALSELKDERAVEPLCEILLDKNYRPRRYAAVALGSIKSTKAIDALKKAVYDVEYVVGDALTALQYIDPKEGDNYLKNVIIKNENSNGLEIGLDATLSGNTLTITFKIKNISENDIYIQWPEIYQANYLIAQDEYGMFVGPILTSMYDYMTSESEFKLIKAGGTFSTSIKGKIKTLANAAQARLAIDQDWPEIIYPKGSIKIIDFNDTALDVGLLKSKMIKLYFVFEAQETSKYWGNQFGLNNIWTGKAASEPINIEIK